MTTPSSNETMPYGVVMRPIREGSPLFEADKPHVRLNGFNLRLEPGPVMVAASWDGEQSCALVLRRNGRIRDLVSIPALKGGQGRHHQSNSGLSTATRFTSTYAQPSSTPDYHRQRRWRSFLSCKSKPRGVLDGHTTGQSRDFDAPSGGIRKARKFDLVSPSWGCLNLFSAAARGGLSNQHYVARDVESSVSSPIYGDVVIHQNSGDDCSFRYGKPESAGDSCRGGRYAVPIGHGIYVAAGGRPSGDQADTNADYCEIELAEVAA